MNLVCRYAGTERIDMIKAAIVGATGYAGAELVKILSSHPEVRIVFLGSRGYANEQFSRIYGNMLNIVVHFLRVLLKITLFGFRNFS